MNNHNLKPAAHCLTVEEASKGGKKSAKNRKQRNDLRKSIQDVLNAEYTDKRTGTKLTGTEAIVHTLMKAALDPDNKNCISACKIIISLVGANKSEFELERERLETELLRAKIDAEKNGISISEPIQIIVAPRE